MVGKFIADSHTDAIGETTRTDQVSARNLGLLAAIFGITGDVEQITVRPQRTARTFIEPFRRYADGKSSRSASFYSQAKHLHAIGHVISDVGMHALPAACAADVGQSGTGNQATSSFLGMIDGGEQSPLRPATVDRIIIEGLVPGSALDQLAEIHAACNRDLSQLVDRGTGIEKAQIGLLHKSNPAKTVFFDLYKSCHRMLTALGVLNSISSNSLSLFSLTVRPRPGMLSSRWIHPMVALGSPSKMYQNSSLPTSTSTIGKYSAIGQFKLAITSW